MGNDGGGAWVGLFVGEPGMTGDEARAFALPTGTVTFLLTDVEGSSRLWELAPDAMAPAIARHYELLDEAIAAHGGVRPVEQGEGDSVVGAFSRPSDAVAAALAAQRAFATESWPEGVELRVRMAVHTGEAQLRDERNYFGSAIIRCARVRSIGHGGQVLVSDATAGLVADRLPADAMLEDLGTHRLKDLGRPERVWQLGHTELTASFPPLRSLDQFRHNLPLQLTPLIGRGADTAELAALLGGERIVTLTGSGGVGKTRLALAVAAEVVEQWPGGVWWIELAPVTEPAGVGRAALAAVGAAEVPNVSPARRLSAELGDAPSLLVLDNCEHLVDECAAFVTELISTSASATVLATSREPLGVGGEVTWRVPSLAVPPTEGRVTLPSLSQYDSVRLFVDRARRARPSFVVDEVNAPAIAQVCHCLDGIPLAIELAAARCRQMTAQQICAELDDRFRLLTGGTRTAMARQQTLAASVAWSHDRLDADEQAMFRRLSVFAGPFPLAAAEAVAAAPGDLDAVVVFDLLSRLSDKSLVAVDDTGDGVFDYRVLETLRAYGLERASGAGEMVGLRAAHAQWWVGWLESVGSLPTDADVADVDRYHGNLQAALEWACDDPVLGLRLLAGVGRSWQTLGRGGAALAAADRILLGTEPAEHGPAWLRAAATMAVLYVQSERYGEFFDLLARTEAYATDQGDAYHAAVARWLRSGMGREESEVLLPMARERSIGWVESLAATAIGLELAEDPLAAARAAAEADVLAAASGNEYLRHWALVNHVLGHISTGDLRESARLARGLLDSRSASLVGTGVAALGGLGLMLGDEAVVAEAAGAAARVGAFSVGFGPAAALAGRAGALLRGEPPEVHPDLCDNANQASSVTKRAALLWILGREAIDAEAGETACRRAEVLARDTPLGRAVVASLAGAHGDDDGRWHEALALAVEHGFRLVAADALEGLAAGAARSEGWIESLRLLGAAERLREETEYRWRFGFEQRSVDEAHAAARAALGEEAAAAASAEGRSLDWRQAAEYARRARGERRRPSHGWDSLTPTEEQVVALVVEGLTNPQIAERLLMGKATVKTHLEHVFVKLGVRSRTELATGAVRRPSPGA